MTLFFVMMSLFSWSCLVDEIFAVEALSFGSYIGESSSLYFVGEKKDFFKKNDINLTIKAYEAGKLALEDVLAGKIDVASLSDFAFVAKSFNQSNIRIIAITGLSEAQRLIVRKDRIQSIADVKGKKIAIMKKTSSEFGLGSFLEMNQLSFQDIQVVNLTPPQMLESMKTGEIDGALIWDPHIYKIKNELKDNAYVLSKNEIVPYHVILATTVEVIQKKTKAIEQLIKALLQAEAFLKENEAEAKEIVKARINDNDDYIDHVWKNESFSVSLPQSLLPTMEDLARWMIQIQLTDKQTKPNYLNFIYFDALDKIKPGAVTIIH